MTDGGIRSKTVATDRTHVWRPYTASEQHAGEDPIVVARAEGSYLYDVDGTRYIDGVASWWTKNLGHRHPRLMDVVRRQSETLMHCAMADMTHAPAAQLAQELVKLAPPGLSRVFFSDNGSTAVEIALKMAFQFWQQNGRPERKRFLALSGSYHGDTLGAMSVGDLEAFHGLYAPLLVDVLRPPFPAALTPDAFASTIGWLSQMLRERGDEIAGVIVEPLVLGAGGMRFWDPADLRRLREAVDRAETFLIADEVFTGFGRTGRFWACEHAGITPDLLCTAKALSGGVLPLAATLATERIYDGFRGGIDRALLHGHTFAGHALGCAIAREVLAIYRDESVLEDLPARTDVLDRMLDEIGRHPGVLRPRRLGMIAAFDVGPPGYEGALGDAVAREARRRGVYLRPLGNVVMLCPALNVPQVVLEELCRATVEAAAQALS